MLPLVRGAHDTILGKAKLIMISASAKFVGTKCALSQKRLDRFRVIACIISFISIQHSSGIHGSGMIAAGHDLHFTDPHIH
jgi:hypothetical protein